MQMSQDVRQARRNRFTPVSFGGGGGCGGGGSAPNWGGACQNFVAGTNVAALATVTFAGTPPVAAGFVVAGVEWALRPPLRVPPRMEAANNRLCGNG